MNVLETTHRASNTPESKWRTMIVRMGSRSVPYVAIALVTALLLSRMYGLRKASLSYPIQPLQTDGILAVYAAKALGANSFLHNDRVGAPFGLDMHDWYQ